MKKIKRLSLNLLLITLFFSGLVLIFNFQIRSYLLNKQVQQYDIANYSKKDLEDNLKRKGNFDFDSVESISNELVLKAQFKNSDLPIIGGIAIPDVKLSLPIYKGLDNISGMATVFLTNFIRCRTSFRMLFRLSLTMSLLGCDDLRQELTVKVRLPR